MTHSSQPSHNLSFPQVRNVFDGAYVALCIGHPLNRYVTIHWEGSGIATNVHDAQTDFLHSFNDWSRKRLGIPSCCVGVLENPTEDGRRNGLHGHYLLHVPDKFWKGFSKRCRPWLEAAGATLNATTLDCQTLNGWNQSGASADYLHLRFGLLDRLRYLSKGMEPGYARFFGVTDLRPQGVVIGKRYYRSEGLNPALVTWPVYSFEQWPGIRVAGPELRWLRWLRFQTGHELAGIRVLPGLGDSMDTAEVALRTDQAIGHRCVKVQGKWQAPPTARQKPADGEIAHDR